MTKREKNQITKFLFIILLSCVSLWPVAFFTRTNPVFGGETFALVTTGLAYIIWRAYLGVTNDR